MGKKVVEKVVKSFVKKHLLTGFTLVEILIVVAILGILAAITIPAFQDYVQQSKESAAKANLRIVREAINRYAAEHDGVPPGYPGAGPPMESAFYTNLIQGNYLSDRPENPFNNKKSIKMIRDNEDLPIAATGTFGWIFKPKTSTFKIDYPGTDQSGTLYYDY